MPFVVVDVVDGDTIKIKDVDGSLEIIRLIGIDTPETVYPTKPVQCFGVEASNRLEALLKDQTVHLEKDTIGDSRDTYGRFLRYVYIRGYSDDSKRDINAEMVEDGYAYAHTTYPFEKSEDYVVLETEARETGRGLWAEGVCEDEKSNTDDIAIQNDVRETNVAVPTKLDTNDEDGGAVALIMTFGVIGGGWILHRRLRKRKSTA